MQRITNCGCPNFADEHVACEFRRLGATISSGRATGRPLREFASRTMARSFGRPNATVGSYTLNTARTLCRLSIELALSPDLDWKEIKEGAGGQQEEAVF